MSVTACVDSVEIAGIGTGSAHRATDLVGGFRVYGVRLWVVSGKVGTYADGGYRLGG